MSDRCVCVCVCVCVYVGGGGGDKVNEKQICKAKSFFMTESFKT